MDTNWIQCILCGLLVLTALMPTTCAQSDVEAHLVLRKYVEKGSSVTLHCETNVPPEKLYKVTWLKCNGTGKFYQYINGRTPPFVNFDVPGAKIDLEHSNQSVVTLKNLDFEAAGAYYCEVSIDSPIFTKESNEEPLHVVLQQQGPPKISLKKRQYMVGEQLLANCTTYKSRPAPHITWLINGKKVNESLTKPLHLFAANGKNVHRSKNHGSGTGHDKGGNTRHPEPTREPAEPNHFGYEIHTSSGYDSSGSSSSFSSLRQRHVENNFNARNGDGGGGAPHSTSSTRHSYNYGGVFGSNTDYHLEEKDKYYETSRKHRPLRGHKFRRHAGTADREARGGSSSGHRGASSSSQLSVDMSELYVPANGRVEITCLATIPAHVGPGEQYADYKTYSVKIDVNMTEVTTSMVEMGGMVADNASSRASTIAGAAQVIIGRMSVVLLSLPAVLLAAWPSLQIEARRIGRMQ